MSDTFQKNHDGRGQSGGGTLTVSEGVESIAREKMTAVPIASAEGYEGHEDGVDEMHKALSAKASDALDRIETARKTIEMRQLNGWITSEESEEWRSLINDAEIALREHINGYEVGTTDSQAFEANVDSLVAKIDIDALNRQRLETFADYPEAQERMESAMSAMQSAWETYWHELKDFGGISDIQKRAFFLQEVFPELEVVVSESLGDLIPTRDARLAIQAMVTRIMDRNV